MVVLFEAREDHFSVGPFFLSVWPKSEQPGEHQCVPEPFRRRAEDFLRAEAENVGQCFSSDRQSLLAAAVEHHMAVQRRRRAHEHDEIVALDQCEVRRIGKPAFASLKARFPRLSRVEVDQPMELGGIT